MSNDVEWVAAADEKPEHRRLPRFRSDLNCEQIIR